MLDCLKHRKDEYRSKVQVSQTQLSEINCTQLEKVA